MTATDAQTSGASGPVAAGDVELWVERRGEGPDVLLIAGLSDPAEAWAELPRPAQGEEAPDRPCRGPR